ncbi:MAG: GGDEF domain-containing protein [Gammaproteobacteria bacterium]|nr:GGDEF domain-containing protein [Gammaproteobacteria bacterium]MDH5652121.1 GGDEF domain-containing protein [Gammaproteobacteria bacterium]
MATPIYSNNSNSAKETETALDFSAVELQRTLKLAGLLQTSLEVSSILDYFLSTVREVVNFDGVHFEYEPLQIDLKIGSQARHRCFYRLRLCEELLGVINFSRKKAFEDEELKNLETLLCQLIYPLRNAILYQKALKAAHMDPLTGANNRAAMDTALQREVELAHRHHIPLSLLVLDLDHFKTVNDRYGHSAGDYILKTLVTCINETKRGSDMLFRFGGEEFTLILTGTDTEGAKRIAERLRRSIELYPFVYDRQEIAMTASFGIATLRPSDNPERLFNKADTALYQAKEAGRNQVHYFAEPDLHSIKNT